MVYLPFYECGGTYVAISSNAQRNATAELLRKLKDEKDPMQRYSQYGYVSAQLMQQSRWRTLIVVSQAHGRGELVGVHRTLVQKLQH